MTNDNKKCSMCGKGIPVEDCTNPDCEYVQLAHDPGTVLPNPEDSLLADSVLNDEKADVSEREFTGTVLAEGAPLFTDEKDNELDRTIEAIFPLDSFSKAPDGSAETMDSRDEPIERQASRTLSAADKVRPQTFEGGIVPPLREIQFPSKESEKEKKLSWSAALNEWNTRSPDSFESDEYRVFDVLGEGGYGVVFEAEHKALGRSVAVKVLKPKKKRKGSGRLSGSGTGSGEFQKRQHQFLHEASVTAVLQHPNIMPVYDFGINPKGDLFYSMKKVDNPQSWDELIDSPERLLGVSEQEAIEESTQILAIKQNVEIFSKLCDAMAYTHSKGIIHRDLKPQNIMIGDYGEVLLIDFGMALDFSRGRKRFIAGGTPTYMSPEMAQHFIVWGEINEARGATVRLLGLEKGSVFLEQSDALGFGTVAQQLLDETDDPKLRKLAKNLVELDAKEKKIAAKISQRSDIYLLGAILYEIAVGTSPHMFPYDSFLSQKPELKNDTKRARRAFGHFLIRAAARNQIYAGDDVISDPLRISLRNIAYRAMETDPKRRFASVEQLQNAISEFNNQVQALELAEKGKQEFSRARGREDYQFLLPALESFRGARQIWPGATEATVLKNSVACEYGRRALKRKDFDAGIEILNEYVDPKAQKHEKVVKVRNDLVQAKKKAQRNRRIGLVATGISALAIPLGILALWFISQVDQDSLRKYLSLSDEKLGQFDKFANFSDEQINQFDKFANFSDEKLGQFDKFATLSDQQLGQFEKFASLTPAQSIKFDEFAGFSEKQLEQFEKFSGFSTEQIGQFDKFAAFSDEQLKQFNSFAEFTPAQRIQFDKFSGFSDAQLTQFNKFAGFSKEQLGQFDKFAGLTPSQLTQFNQFASFDTQQLKLFDQFADFSEADIKLFNQYASFSEEDSRLFKKFQDPIEREKFEKYPEEVKRYEATISRLDFAASYGKVPPAFDQIQRLANQNRLADAKVRLNDFVSDASIKAQYRNGWLTDHFRKKLNVKFPESTSGAMMSLGDDRISAVVPLDREGEAFVIGSREGQVQVWKLTPGREPMALESLELPSLEEGRVVSAAISPDEKFLAFAIDTSRDDQQHLWVVNLETNQSLRLKDQQIKLRGLRNAVPLAVSRRCESLAFLDNQLLVSIDELTGDSDPSDRLRVTVRKINEAGTEISDEGFRPFKIGASSALPGQGITYRSSINCGGRTAQVSVAFDSLDELGIQSANLTCLQVSESGEITLVGEKNRLGLLPTSIEVVSGARVLCGYGDGRIEEYPFRGLNENTPAIDLGNANESKIVRIESSNDGFAISGSEDGKLVVWKRSVGPGNRSNQWSLIKTLTGQPAGLSSMKLGPTHPENGLTIFSGDAKGNVRYWEPETSVHDSVVNKDVLNQESTRTITSAAVDSSPNRAAIPAHAYGLKNGNIVYFNSKSMIAKGSGLQVSGNLKPGDQKSTDNKSTIRSPFARFDSTFQDFDAMGIVDDKFMVLKEDGTFFFTSIDESTPEPTYQSRSIDLLRVLNLQNPERKFLPLIASSSDKPFFFTTHPGSPDNLLWWTYRNGKFGCQPVNLSSQFSEVKQLEMSPNGEWLAVIRRVGQPGNKAEQSFVSLDDRRPKFRADDYHPNDYLAEIYRIKDGAKGKLAFDSRSRHSYSVFDPAFVSFSPDSTRMIVQFHKKGVDRETWVDNWKLGNSGWNESAGDELLDDDKVYVLGWESNGKEKFVTRKSRELFRAIQKEDAGPKEQAYEIQFLDGSTPLSLKSSYDQAKLKTFAERLIEAIQGGRRLRTATLKKYQSIMEQALDNDSVSSESKLVEQIEDALTLINQSIRERTPKTVRYSGAGSGYYVLYPNRVELESGVSAFTGLQNARDIRVFGNRAVVLDDWGFHLVGRNGPITKLAPRENEVLSMSLSSGVLASIYGGKDELGGLGIIRDMNSESPRELGRITGCRELLVSPDANYVAAELENKIQLFAVGEGFEKPILSLDTSPHSAMQWVANQLLSASSQTGQLDWRLTNPATKETVDPKAENIPAWAASIVSIPYSFESGEKLVANLRLPESINGDLVQFELAPVTKKFLAIGSTSRNGLELWSTYDEAKPIEISEILGGENISVSSFTLSEIEAAESGVSGIGTSLAVVEKKATDAGRVESSVGFFVLASSENPGDKDFKSMESTALSIGGALESSIQGANSPLIESSEIIELKFSGDGRTLLQVNEKGIKSFLSQ